MIITVATSLIHGIVTKEPKILRIVEPLNVINIWQAEKTVKTAVNPTPGIEYAKNLSVI